MAASCHLLYECPRISHNITYEKELEDTVSRCFDTIFKRLGSVFACRVTIRINNAIFCMIKQYPMTFPRIERGIWSPHILMARIISDTFVIAGYGLSDARILFTNHGSTSAHSPTNIYSNIVDGESPSQSAFPFVFGSITLYSRAYALTSLRCPPADKSHHSLSSECIGCSSLRSLTNNFMTRKLPIPSLLKSNPTSPMMIFAEKNGITSEMYLFNTPK